MILRMEIIPLAAIVVANFVPAPQAPADPDRHKGETADCRLALQRLGTTAEAVTAMALYDTGSRRVGEVDGIRADGGGISCVAVVDVEGMGRTRGKPVVIAFDTLRYDGGRLVTDLPAATIEGLPAWH